MSFLIRILLLALLAAGAAAQPAPIIVGAVVSQSGALAALADGYRKGLRTWEAEVNAAGGLLGRPVELRLLDDGSSAVRAGELYGELIGGGADVLIGPFGSAATLMAKAQAERAQRVLVNGAGASRAIHDRASRYVFQSTVPYASYGDGVLALAEGAGLRKLFILARDDVASREMAEATRQAASRHGLAAGEIVLYDASAEDFSSQVLSAQAQSAEGWIAFGGVREVAEMTRAMEKLGYAPPLVFLRDAADPRFIALVGQDAEHTLAAQPYDAAFATPGNAAFVARFTADWGVAPDFSAAQGYAAATVLAAAVRRAGSLDQQELRAVLAVLQTGTVLGGYRVDPQSGVQLAARTALVQIQRGKPAVVWPAAPHTATPRPNVPWAERRLIE